MCRWYCRLQTPPESQPTDRVLLSNDEQHAPDHVADRQLHRLRVDQLSPHRAYTVQHVLLREDRGQVVRWSGGQVVRVVRRASRRPLAGRRSWRVGLAAAAVAGRQRSRRQRWWQATTSALGSARAIRFVEWGTRLRMLELGVSNQAL